jgi:hypothetical protein
VELAGCISGVHRYPARRDLASFLKILPRFVLIITYLEIICCGSTVFCSPNPENISLADLRAAVRAGNQEIIILLAENTAMEVFSASAVKKIISAFHGRRGWPVVARRSGHAAFDRTIKKRLLKSLKHRTCPEDLLNGHRLPRLHLLEVFHSQRRITRNQTRPRRLQLL